MGNGSHVGDGSDLWDGSHVGSQVGEGRAEPLL